MEENVNNPHPAATNNNNNDDTLDVYWKETEPLEFQELLTKYQNEYDMSSKLSYLFKPHEKVYYSGNVSPSTSVLKVLYLFLFSLLLVGFISSLVVGLLFRHKREEDYFHAIILASVELLALIIFVAMYYYIIYTKSVFKKFILTQERIIILDKKRNKPIQISFFLLKNKLRNAIFHIPNKGTLQESINESKKSFSNVEIEWVIPLVDHHKKPTTFSFFKQNVIYTTYSDDLEGDLGRIYTLLKRTTGGKPQTSIQPLSVWGISLIFFVLLVVSVAIVFGIYVSVTEFIRLGDYIIFCFIPMGVFALLYYTILLIYYILYIRSKIYHIQFRFGNPNSFVTYRTFSDTTFII
jgi:hypothetical protein